MKAERAEPAESPWGRGRVSIRTMTAFLPARAAISVRARGNGEPAAMQVTLLACFPGPATEPT